jgi:outer membrane receptor protein involved in Fe transport
MMIFKKAPKITILLLTFSLFVLNIYAQNIINGNVVDKKTKTPIIGAIIQCENKGTVTDYNGNFSIETKNQKTQIDISFTGYKKISTKLESSTTANFEMEEQNILLQTTVISSSRFETEISQSPISLEVIDNKMADKLNTNSIEQVLDRVPGVQMLDGQANIRGGSGYSYGAGSRVMLVMDEIPILQPDAGFPNWDDLPLENVEQIEVLKGAASALYGSAAMNGVIHFRSKFPGSKPFTSVSILPKFYLAPDVENYWWKNKSFQESPKEIVTSIVDRRKINTLDFSSAFVYTNKMEANESVESDNMRLNILVRKRIKDKMTIALGLNGNKGKSSNFFYWNGEASYSGDSTSKTNSNKLRFSLDPSITYNSSKNFKHKLFTRWYFIDNQNNGNQSNKSNNYFSEYQVQKAWKNIGLSLAGGLYFAASKVDAPLYGDTLLSSSNKAIYIQAEQKLSDKFFITGGVRYETFDITGPSNVGGFNFKTKSTDSRPVFRFGLNYNIYRQGFLRASVGQGFRFPTLAEKYIKTNAGALLIAPNPNLEPEHGISYEIGYKHGFRFYKINGLFDIAGFYSEYRDMMEFGIIFQDSKLYFQSSNVGDTNIPGLETSISLQRKYTNSAISLQSSYTFINPKFNEFDISGNELYLTKLDQATRGQLNAFRSTSDNNVLKYRSRHLFKFDLNFNYKAWTMAYDFMYSSNVEAVDPIFEELKGIKSFRLKHNTGNRIHGISLAFHFKKFELQTNVFNLFNELYTNRPGYLEPPRHLVGRITYKINS